MYIIFLKADVKQQPVNGKAIYGYLSVNDIKCEMVRYLPCFSVLYAPLYV